MHIDEFNRTKTDLNTAIEKIKANNNRQYQWCAVENKVGCPFEIGGYNDGELKLKADIPKYTNGKMVVHENGNTNLSYSIELDNVQCRKISKHKKNLFSSNEALIEFLDNRDFRVNPVRIESYTVIVEVEKIKHKIVF